MKSDNLKSKNNNPGKYISLLGPIEYQRRCSIHESMGACAPTHVYVRINITVCVCVSVCYILFTGVCTLQKIVNAVFR